MPRFIGHGSTYLALLVMILLSASVTFKEIKGSMKSHASLLTRSSSSTASPSLNQNDPLSNEELADLAFWEDREVVLPTFDESLREGHKNERKESKKEKGPFERMETLAKQISEKLTGRWNQRFESGPESTVSGMPGRF